MWTAWPVLLGVSEQPARHPPRNRSIRCPHTLAAYSYCMRTNFFDNLSDRFVQGPNVSLSVQRPDWHKLLLIKFLTIHGKWVFSVNTAQVGANGACWGLLGNKTPPVWVNIWRKHEVKTWTTQAERGRRGSTPAWSAVLHKSHRCFQSKILLLVNFWWFSHSNERQKRKKS